MDGRKIGYYENATVIEVSGLSDGIYLLRVTDKQGRYIIIEHELKHEIIAADESAETVTLTLTYDKNERDIVHQIEDLVEDHKEAD